MFMHTFLSNILQLTFHLFSYEIAGVASGATRAALTQHFALQNNAADIAAKVSYLSKKVNLIC